jgi:hypothetical protein
VVEESQAAEVLDCLKVLGVELVTEWDTLVFLYRHSATLCTAAQLASLIGYDGAEVGSALHRLEALRLIQRSRISHGMRVYRFSAPADLARQNCLLELMKLTNNRAGRLILLKHLKRYDLELRPKRHGGLRLA